MCIAGLRAEGSPGRSTPRAPSCRFAHSAGGGRSWQCFHTLERLPKSGLDECRSAKHAMLDNKVAILG